MIIGAHSIIYSKNPEADRAFLRDVLKFPAVDVGGGWLIFGLPPSELAVHPGEKNNVAQANPDIVARLDKILREQHTPSKEFPIPALDKP